MRGRRLFEQARQAIRTPVFWILFAAAVSRAVGLGWGLPASDGWDDDGVAPRNFLVGLAQTYAGGAYFTYPPLHMILLAIPTAPGWIAALFHARAFTPHDVIAEFIQVPYMTYFAVVARLVSAGMSVGTVYLIGRMAGTLAGRRAGLYAAATCALNATLLYYGQVTNLDGPYLFWSALSLWLWMRVILERAPRLLRWAALSAAAAVATKDQAYAVFLVSIPTALLIWFAVDPWPRRNAGAVLRPLIFWAAVAVLALLAIDGAVTNPTGFARRLAFLAGPASQDYAAYEADWTGRARLLLDMVASFPRSYPWAAAGLALLGAGLHAVRSRGDRSRLVAGLLPVLAVMSFTAAFNLVALRSENRFLLPQTVLLAVYVGIFLDWLSSAGRPLIRRGGEAAAVLLAGMAFYQCMGIEAAFLRDPRYDAERWLQSWVRPGETIEAYGLNVFLPRFPSDAVVTRLDRKPLSKRNPLPNVTELAEPFEAIGARNPQFIVVSDFWVRDYLDQDTAGQKGGGEESGRIVQAVHRAIMSETGARSFFQSLFNGELSYRLAYRADYEPGLWPPVAGYESLAQTIYVFERRAGSRTR